MNKYRVTYTAALELDVWAETQSAADLIAQTQPNYYATLAVTQTDTFPYALGDIIYYFDSATSAILEGIVTDINFVSTDSVKVFVRLDNRTTSQLFMHPTETVSLYTSLTDLVDYLGRELPTTITPIQLAIPTGLQVSDITTTSFKLSWLNVDNATGYRVYKDGVVAVSDARSTSVLISGLSPNTTYSLQVSALSAAGETDKSSALSGTTIPSVPTVPNGLVIDTLTDTSVNIDWNASATATSYRVYLNSALVSSPATNTVTLTGLVASTNYSVQVSAVNSGGESIKSATLAILTLPPIPAAPVNLAHNNLTQTSFDVAWEYSVGADTYDIYVNGVLYDTGIVLNAYSLTGLTPATNYKVKLKALNITGASSFSAELSINTLP